MSPRLWRCFVAVPLGAALRRDLAAAVAGWRERPDLARLRWTDPDAWHLTLVFLGWVDARAIARLTSAVGGIAATHAPMRLRTGGLGAFPSPGRARVAWYGVADADQKLAALASDLRSALKVDPAPFSAHVTLARARREPVDLRGWKADASAPEGELAVERLELMRSHLGRGPARYETLASMQLGAAVRV